MVKEYRGSGADIIMLDNMTPEQMAEAIRLIDGRAKTECSGNITKEKYQNDHSTRSGLCFQRCPDTFSTDLRYQPETLESNRFLQ